MSKEILLVHSTYQISEDPITSTQQKDIFGEKCYFHEQDHRSMCMKHGSCVLGHKVPRGCVYFSGNTTQNLFDVRIFFNLGKVNFFTTCNLIDIHFPFDYITLSTVSCVKWP